MSSKKIIVIGGGAGGFFGAINAAVFHPDSDILLLEKSNTFLGKVKVSGGGRCNVTHACFENHKLIEFYPRGRDFLAEVFEQFNPSNTIKWFEERGVKLKTEADGRMFPESNSSQTIIDCFLKETEKHKIEVKTGHGLVRLERNAGQWEVFSNDQSFLADKILIAAGSSAQIWKVFEEMGHTIIEPVPSLFTFNIKDPRLDGLPGLSMEGVEVAIQHTKFKASGSVLITHWGLSGPGILKLSSFAARELQEKNYDFAIELNWVGQDYKTVLAELKKLRDLEAKKLIGSQNYFSVPKRLWKSICDHLKIADLKWASCGNAQLEKLAVELSCAVYQANGKSTFKEEFVTAGGIDLAEVNNVTMESKKLPGVFFAGEVLNIDAVTGGFNFQAAWSCSWLAAKNM